MAENKTKQRAGSPAAFIKRVTNAQQRKDCAELIAMMRRATGKPPKMWGPSIIGFGSYHYVYDSGREGDMPLAAFSPRKPSFVLYLGSVLKDKKVMSQLGKCKTAGGCLHIKKLDDVDRGVLRQLVATAVNKTRKKYGAGSHR